jgi:antitoxin (DNA-binding transcriptional repressor) of toxin-antitoxin stability system
MRQVNMHEAKTHLSRLVDEAAKGEESVIAEAEKPLARPISAGPRPRQRGLLKGQISITDDFDAPLPEEIRADFEHGR